MSNTTQAIERSVSSAGTQAELARRVGVTPSMVNQWIKGVRPVPVDKCASIERATAGDVRRWDLRPDDWHLIWPELVGTEGSPEPKATEQAARGT